MSIYAISDIHGCNDAFRFALKKIKLKKTDTLILLGDLIDRGFDSKGVLDTVLLLIKNNFNVICLRGNHEQMFLDSFNDYNSKINWIKNGGNATLSSFYTSNLENIPSVYVDFIKTFKFYYEYENYIFVHAGLNFDNNNPFEDINSMIWMRDVKKYEGSNLLNNKFIIHGHNPTVKLNLINQISTYNHIICIDNGSFIKNNEEYGSICVFDVLNYKLIFSKNENNR